MEYKAPKFKEDAFNCPLCGAYAHMRWGVLTNNRRPTMYHEATCSCCATPNLWRTIFTIPADGENLALQGEMIYPDNGVVALPEKDMPENVEKDYMEAARVFSRSPRAAAALLRLGLQKLCKHLGQKGENINADIRALAADNTLPPNVVKVADTVRITGNNAVHPGEMSDKDVDYVASKMFGLLNFIVKKGISEPKELNELYSLTPEGPRMAAEAKDAKTKPAST